MRYRSTHWLMMTLGVLLLPPVVSAQDSADPEGVVRLGGIRQTSCDTGNCGADVSYGTGCDSIGCDSDCCDSYGCDAYLSDGSGYGRDERENRRLIRRAKARNWLSGGSASRCGNGCGYGYGGCQNGACGYGAGCGRHMTCGVCGSGHCTNPCHAKFMHALHWLSPYHSGCTYSPDHGWAPPGHFPQQRVAATYRNWFPNSWTGQPSNADPNFRYPMVYQPTDTTQLGYYYQRVPQWMPRAGMIPPTPQPDEFHTPDYGTHYNGVVDVGYGCPQQGDVYSDVSYQNNSAHGSEGTVIGEPTPIESQPEAPVNPGQNAPPAPGNTVPPVPSGAPTPVPEPPAAQPEQSAGAPMLYPVPNF